MKLPLFDLHCDTALEMLHHNQPLTKNDLAVSLTGAKIYEKYCQVMALWTPNMLDDEAGWEINRQMLQNLKSDPAFTSAHACLRTTPDPHCTLPQCFLAVEDVRILNGDLERINILHSDGVRIITPMWSGISSIGGAHNTDVGLTPFGKQALIRALELGIILDISHASVASAEEIFALANEHSLPVIASHSNAYAIRPVSRNLRDDQIAKILSSGGLIGINLYQNFLAEEHASVYDVLRHIEYFLSLGAENALALGCDMDGAELPDDLPDISALPRIAECMAQANYSEKLIHKLFFGNAYQFAAAYFQP